jgi:predicted transcriptional regulator
MPGATATITVRISAETKAKLDRLAEATRRSRSFLAADALTAYADFELGIIDAIDEGLADARAGRVVPHEQVVAETEAIIRAARKRKAKAAGAKRTRRTVAA